MNILISSCLLGEEVRYDGKSSSSSIKNKELFLKIINEFNVFSICPELSGGLTTPRAPAEIIKEKVITTNGLDVTYMFNQGALNTLSYCKKNSIKIAILKSNSPSCGNNKIYDGTFSSVLKEAEGVTVKLLRQNGIKVFNENELEQFCDLIKSNLK
ncbi:uncharacterized protein YbbK (DUF523 family) [Malaciobacter marinus]|uniref:Uncharacterized protein YbbK (DUF523 family) n=1 Tax=Malaciobacter marinus TaxID=505249 RepID=A0AB36ZWV6_9BACT|nr:DUF523 domain-containing protein [Malaciobacter marinus]PPK60790.1 uncharacterized protein YbbK (DUF523 family) [Malaciobacter marinus]SKB41428.1 Uncharacterized conserved protein YbbK, DUF523 family [Malaciobacter marinus]